MTIDAGSQFLVDNCRSLFNVADGGIGSMLYVGHRHDTHPWWRQQFAEALGSPTLDILDIDTNNLQSAAQICSGINKFYLGDIRDPGACPTDYGIVFWDGGPEHLPKQESLDLLVALRSRHKLIVIKCPWGYQPQGQGPDDWEFHHWGPQPEDFEAIGMFTRTFGIMFDGRGGGHGDVVAWF